jgi:hypothetical protein
MRRVLLLAIAAVAVLALAAPAPASQPPAATEPEAVPLAAPTPDWYTPQLHEQVLAAGAEGVPLPAEADVPMSALAFTGIRPGAWMISPAWCTMNFVFGSSSSTALKGNGKGKNGGGGSGLHIGTAGHCTEVGDEVVLVMAPGVLVNIGRTVKSVDRGVGDDFALVEIRPELHASTNPSMAIIAGPTRTGSPAFGQPVEHVGHGVAVGTGGTPRAGVVGYTGGGDTNDDGAAYGWAGAASPGDSGSGVRAATGEAVGNLTHLVVGTKYVPAVVAGTTAAKMERIAGMSIACASLIPNPLPSDPGLGC